MNDRVPSREALERRVKATFAGILAAQSRHETPRRFVSNETKYYAEIAVTATAQNTPASRAEAVDLLDLLEWAWRLDTPGAARFEARNERGRK